MKIGFQQVVINPAEPADRMKGKGRKQTEVADDLHARVVLLEKEGQKPVYMVSIDSVELWKPFKDEIQKACEAALGKEIDLIESVTHSHLCPFNPTDPVYAEQLKNAIVEAVTRLEAEEYEKVEYAYNYAYFDQVGKSRVDLYDSVHLYAETLSLYGDGKRIGTFLIHNCHPTIIDLSTVPFTSEYPGACIRSLKEAHPDEFFTFLLGPAGDISSHNVRKARDYNEMLRLAAKLTDEYERQLNMQTVRKPLDILKYEEYILPLKREPFDYDHMVLPDDVTEDELKRIEVSRGGRWPVPEREILPEHTISRLIFSKDYSMVFEPFELYSEFYGAVQKDRCSLITVSNGFDHYIPGLYQERIATGFQTEITMNTKRKLWNLIGRLSAQMPIERI